MDFFNKHKTTIIALIIIALLIGSVFGWNFIVKKQKEKKIEKTVEVDTSDVNNVSVVDKKLNGDDYRITQAYLYNYTKYKSSTWYMSTGVVTKINKKGEDTILEIRASKDGDKVLIATIDNSKLDVNVYDNVYFVGTVNIGTSEMNLAAISTEEINYSKYKEIMIDDLINNLRLIKETHFIVSGYMVTDTDKYKLYESKDVYKKDTDTIKYFTIKWEDEFNYTGSLDVKLDCMIEDTYVLSHCSLLK